MKKLKVIQREENKYYLMSDDNEGYLLNINFLKVEDCDRIKNIYISSELLDKNYYEYSNYYTFGKLFQSAGRKICERTIQDIVIIEIDNKLIYLQRLYG